MRKVIFAENEYYHILNRGVDKRQIFQDDEDRYRFLHGIYEFNDSAITAPFIKRIGKHISEASYKSIREAFSKDKKRDKLVEVCCFCLMPNHFHLILKQLKDGGISKFMHKLGTGFTNYFNGKNERNGSLFQGRFKAVHIETDAQMMHLSRYIHVLNPGELVEPQIREGIVNDPAKLKDFLKNYKWSSYLDFIGQENYSSLINKEAVAGYFKTEKEYEKFAMSWKMDNLEKISHIIIE